MGESNGKWWDGPSWSPTTGCTTIGEGCLMVKNERKIGAV